MYIFNLLTSEITEKKIETQSDYFYSQMCEIIELKRGARTLNMNIGIYSFLLESVEYISIIMYDKPTKQRQLQLLNFTALS